MLLVFVIITLAMTLPALSEAGDWSSNANPSGYIRWSQQEIRENQVNELQYLSKQREIKLQREAARQEWLDQQDTYARQKERDLGAYLDQLFRQRYDRAPASVTRQSFYEERDKRRRVSREREAARRAYVEEMRRHINATGQARMPALDRRIDALRKSAETD